MKSFDEVKALATQLLDEYGPSFEKVGNNLSVGISKSDKTGEFTIAARLTNDKLKSSLPATYHGVKLEIKIIGAVTKRIVK